jgi:hypothetical protein
VVTRPEDLGRADLINLTTRLTIPGRTIYILAEKVALCNSNYVHSKIQEIDLFKQCIFKLILILILTL